MYLPNATDLMIVGQRPEGFQKYLFIEAEDDERYVWRERNIYKKLLLAIHHPQVSENFIYAHDDHFLLRVHNMIPDYYANYFGGTGAYSLTVKNTNSEKNFDVHVPKVINKTRFLQTVASLNWNKPYGYCIKTMYCKDGPQGNWMHVEDLNLRRPMDQPHIQSLVKNKNFFSCRDKALNPDLRRVLHTLYQKPSRWEK